MTFVFALPPLAFGFAACFLGFFAFGAFVFGFDFFPDEALGFAAFLSLAGVAALAGDAAGWAAGVAAGASATGVAATLAAFGALVLGALVFGALGLLAAFGLDLLAFD